MEDFQQPRSNPSPHHYFLGSTTDAVGGGRPLQGARTAYAWVVAAKERRLSYSGQRTRPTVVSPRLSASMMYPTTPLLSLRFIKTVAGHNARKRRVAEVLWRLFNNRAKTLADTIVTSCCCGGVILQGARMRVVAATEQRLSSSGEPSDRLCFCDQLIVRRTIEMIISAQPSSSNVLCSDYDKACDFHVVNWSRWLTDLFGIQDNNLAEDETKS
ncbi:hypothetical protein RHGRI_026031 [Rhododendron griersonianum]|uniref:Uncharacterized protein n=1 Tax=Rhododendron griersonianum TaxID=479676 RepID=A0AAV6IRC0_9ERIC|nr:hypothetical protein RHGRI_026031 [Rhododendron griersonianum]